MPRYERIPIIDLPPEKLKEINQLPLSKIQVTVNKLRHVKISFPGHDEIARKLLIKKLKNDKRTKEALTNTKLIESCNEFNTLFSYLSTSVGCDAITLLNKKLKSINKDLYKMVLTKLEDAYNDLFIDNTIVILANELRINDISENILEFLKLNKMRDPLDFSSMLMILGQSKNKGLINLLYSFYIFLKDNFPEEEYFEGPLLAIKDISI